MDNMDRIFYNGQIRTLDDQYPCVSAVAVKNGIVMAVGSDEEICARLQHITRPDHPARGVLAAYRETVSASNDGATWLYRERNNTESDYK